ncbi:unnamed protein product [Gongylonema pulchrum]|uniref:V-type proton ATPase subunit a n=1 Tax=Gongylonema pulchrum TaxID=637853 RepID=A0A183DKU2_9BILA|nr:unnamed protein product [Gongylonema pulchrum]
MYSSTETTAGVDSEKAGRKFESATTSGLSAVLLAEKGVYGEVEVSGKHIESGDKDRIMHEIVRDAEELAEMVNERMARVVDKLQSARDRLTGFQNLIEMHGDKPAIVQHKLTELREILPLLIKMYRNELGAKRAALNDLASFDNRDIFLAITASWSHQAFIDRSLLSRLYSMIV